MDLDVKKVKVKRLAIWDCNLGWTEYHVSYVTVLDFGVRYQTSLNYRRREEPSLVSWNPFSFLLSSAAAIAGRRLCLRGWGLSAAPPCRCVRPSSSGQLLPLLRAAGGWSTWCSSTLDLLPPQAVTSFRLFTASLYPLQLKQGETNLHPSGSCVWPLMSMHEPPGKQTWSHIDSYGSWWLGRVLQPNKLELCTTRANWLWNKHASLHK